eukprot:CAMPEP_0174832878 /NCGR_PEP_ID=MMETSP1114-20130205/3906_1 /TAXON_ID=312471 /ORGANISM="Neobodo designis, Strain CCAP 1951/1" /LENGTH=557 /DNA_ID=CAMNT_0016066745 /DNA_START=39 /DNA_END=1712 /DNA_ORIENTATION=-
MADYRFIRDLRLRGPDDKDFLRAARITPEPSLRSRATAALSNTHTTESCFSGPPSSTDVWYERFGDVADQVRSKAAQLGLSVFDLEYLTAHLIEGRPLRKLPILEYVDELLDSLCSVAQSIRSVALRRQKHIDRLSKACGAGTGAGQRTRKGESACGPTQHEKIAALLRDIDAMSIQIMEHVKLWRSHLQFPLPFHVDGENILFKLATDYAIGSVISLSCGHLRNTARYSAFFYASPFDAVAAGSVAPSAKAALADWESLVHNELSVQRTLVREQLSFARMGLFHCVLRLPRSMLSVAGMKPGCVLHITDKRRKQDLVTCLGTAYRHLLRRRQQATGKTSNLAGLATFSPKALHLQYLRKWIEWVAIRREKREAADTLLRESSKNLLRDRWNDWAGRVELERERARKWRPFLQRTQLQLLRTYTQKWFVHHAFGSISRQVRRVLFLRYFHTMHFLVVRRRLAKDFAHESRDDAGRVAYPCHLQALRTLVGLASSSDTPSLDCVRLAREEVLIQHRLTSDERSERLRVAIDEQASRASLSGEFWLRSFVLQSEALLSK